MYSQYQAALSATIARGALILLCDLVQIAGLLLSLRFPCPSTILIFCLRFHLHFIAHAAIN
jgi:hypothetical protein